MRQIGTLSSEKDANTFVDYLLTQGIDSQCDSSGDAFDIWIRDEDQIDRAKPMLAEFQANPQAAAFESANQEARKIREQKVQARLQHAKNKMDVRRNWQTPGGGPQRRPVTMALVIGSVLVAFVTQFGDFTASSSGQITQSQSVLAYLLFLDPFAVHEAKIQAQLTPNPKSFQERLLKTSIEEHGADDQNALVYRTWSLLNGQLWRLFTPCFIHFGLIHLIFNLWMLFQIGSLLESRVGSTKYLIFVLAAGGLSNVVQGLVPMGVDWLPKTMQGTLLFGGMSGVLYGLFGWALARQQRGISGGLFFPPSTIFLLLAWMVAGFLFENLHIANWCHGVGFLVGMVTGYLPVFNDPPTTSRRG